MMNHKSQYLNLKAGSNFNPNKCLCDTIADNYIKCLRDENINIINKKKYIPTYSKNLTMKQITNTISIPILKHILDTSELTDFKIKKYFDNKNNLPLFYSLNLKWTQQDDKHSMYLIFDYNKDLQKYTIELFDSNGPLNTNELVDQEYQYTLPNEYNVSKALEILCNIIYESIGKRPIPIEVLKYEHNINICSDGHCDALSLFYVTLRQSNSNYQEAVRELIKYLPKKKKIDKIIALINTKIKCRITSPGLKISNKELSELSDITDDEIETDKEIETDEEIETVEEVEFNKPVTNNTTISRPRTRSITRKLLI